MTLDPWSATTGWFPDRAGVLEPVWTSRLVTPVRLKGRHGPGIHILMIEDDPSIADMYRLQLEHDGYRVTNAMTGEVALTTLEDDVPDVVLLDLLLPDRSGFEVLSMINERFPNHPPVVILSNYGEPSMIDRGRSLGAIEYLVKSRVTPGDISEQIARWVEQGRRRRGRRDS